MNVALLLAIASFVVLFSISAAVVVFRWLIAYAERRARRDTGR